MRYRNDRGRDIEGVKPLFTVYRGTFTLHIIQLNDFNATRLNLSTSFYGGVFYNGMGGTSRGGT